MAAERCNSSNPCGGFKLFDYPLQAFEAAFERFNPAGILLVDDSFNGTRKIASVSHRAIRDLVESKLAYLGHISAIDAKASSIIVLPGRSLIVHLHQHHSVPIEIPMQYIRIRALEPASPHLNSAKTAI